jgi:hypothetical protein
MGNRKAREFMKSKEDEAAWERAISQPRLAICDVHARGIGLRRLQVIVCPSFDEGRCWEIRQRDDEWWLFRSEIVSDWPEIQLVGYQPVPIATGALSSFFARVVSLSLPIAPCLNGMDGADGDIYQLAVFGDMYSEWRLQWWSEAPASWRPLVEITEEIIEAFAAATRKCPSDDDPH